MNLDLPNSSSSSPVVLRDLSGNGKLIMKLIAVLLAVFVITGCSYRGVYEGIQTSKQQECANLPPTQYEECMEGADLSYEDYESTRIEASSN